MRESPSRNVLNQPYLFGIFQIRLGVRSFLLFYINDDYFAPSLNHLTDMLTQLESKEKLSTGRVSVPILTQLQHGWRA